MKRFYGKKIVFKDLMNRIKIETEVIFTWDGHLLMQWLLM